MTSSEVLLVPVEHQVVRHAVREAVTHQLHRVERAVALELRHDHGLVEVELLEARVGLHAAHEVRRRLVERADERVDVVGEPFAHRVEAGAARRARLAAAACRRRLARLRDGGDAARDRVGAGGELLPPVYSFAPCSSREQRA